MKMEVTNIFEASWFSKSKLKFVHDTGNNLGFSAYNFDWNMIIQVIGFWVVFVYNFVNKFLKS